MSAFGMSAREGIDCLREKIAKVERLALTLKEGSEEEKKFSAAVENFAYRKALFNEFKRIYYSDFTKLTKEEKIYNLLLHSINIENSFLAFDLSKVLIFAAIKSCIENSNLFDECFEFACKNAGLKNEN